MLFRRLYLSLFTLVLASALTGAAAAQTTTTAKAPESGKLTQGDRTFMMHAAQGGVAEVQLGQLAQQNGSSDQVKQFGQRMVTDHGQANDQLKTLAASKQVNVPASLDPKDRQLQARLSKLKGAAFDRAYINAMVADHQHDVAEFRREAQTSKDPDVKAFVQQTLPTLEDHLKMAQTAQKSLTAKTTAAKQSPTNQ